MNFDYLESSKILEKYGLSLSEQEYENNKSKKVIVGMSGGVDSSVSALICKLQGYEVLGIFMKNWQEDEYCPATEDYKDVVRVCEKIDIPYYSINFSKDYQDNVFSDFVKELKQGHTPNPDILCNREIKFKVFYNQVMDMGADYLATGHYCQKEQRQGRVFLKKGVDKNKDQTYFLYTMQSEVLKNVLFPIGNIEKPIVRQIASDFNLATSQKKDSTGICFIGERKFKSFISDYIKSTKGEFVTLEGETKGVHDGLPFYTIGQRKGLGIGGPGEPWFVVEKRIESNQVVVAQGVEHPALYAWELEAGEISLVNSDIEIPKRLKAKIRYRQQDQDCEVIRESDKLFLKFDQPQRAITLRQSVVLYDEDICLGGAMINAKSASLHELGQTLN